MEPQRERAGRHLKKGRKRRRGPNMLVGAAEAMRARWELEESQPEAKVSNGEPEWAVPGLEPPQPPSGPQILPGHWSPSPTH